MMIEAGEVRPSTQIAHRQRRRIAVVRFQPDIVDRPGPDRIGHDPRRGAEERLERRGAAAAEGWTGKCAILIEVRDDARAQRVLELLDPFRRADEAPLLAVPGGEDDGAGGLLSVTRERGERARRLEHRHGAAHVVARTRSPGIAMTADHDPFIRPATAPDHPDGVPDLMEGAGAALRLDMQPRAPRSRADVIVERECSLPALRHGRTRHWLEEAPRVAVTHRDDGNLRDVERIFGATSGAFNGRAS